MDTLKSFKAVFGNDSLKLRLGALEFPCFLLENGQRILSKNGVQKAMGYDGKSENWLFEFLMHINRLTVVDPALLESLGKTIIFEIKKSHETQLQTGLDPKLFVEACKTIVKANEDGFLYLSEQKFARNADTVLKAIGDDKIEDMIDFACGFERFKQNHKDALARWMTVNEMEYGIWVKSFPDRFFETIFALQSWKWEDLNLQKEMIAEYFADTIFSRVEPELLEVLLTSKPKMKYRRKNTPEHYLENENLASYLRTILLLADTSANNPAIFEQLLNKGFPKKRELSAGSINPADKKNEDETFSALNENLVKALEKKK